MKQMVLVILLMSGISLGAETAPRITTDDLRRLAAMEGKPDGCENNGRREIHLVEPTEVILYKVDQHGKEEPVLNGHVILPRGTHVEREPEGKHYYTCQGGFRIWVKSGSIHEPRRRPSPKEIPRVAEPTPPLIPLPNHLVITVEMKHSGEFTVNHKLDPSLLALLRNKERIEESDGARAWRGLSHREERCFDSGTGITLIGATTAGYFLGARNPDGSNAEIRNNNRGLLIGAGVAAIGAAFLPGTPGCKAGAAALGLGGGYLFGRTVKSPDEVREETPPTLVQPPQPGPGGIPPPDPNAPPFPPADPPN